MMTTFAAIGGALPLALDLADGTEMRRPLGSRSWAGWS